MLRGGDNAFWRSRLDDMTTESVRGGGCTQVSSTPSCWVNNHHHHGAVGNEENNLHNLGCCSTSSHVKKNALTSGAEGNFHNNRGSSTASTATCSSSSMPPPPHEGRLPSACMTDKVLGVVSSVKTLGRNPVLATLIWLLGGSTTEVEVPRDHESRHGRGIRRHRWQQSSAGSGGAPPSSSDAASDRDSQVGEKVVLFLSDRHESVRVDPARGPVMGTRRHAGGTSDSQCIYPEHIAVEKITHMDRVESDDLLPCQQMQQQSAYDPGAANGADVSPQWGWYVTLTPPQAEYFAKEAAKARARASQELRPPMP